MTNIIRTPTPVEQPRILPAGTVFDYDNQGEAQRMTLETPVQIQQQQPGTLAGEPQRAEEINEKAAAINSIQSLREGKLPTNKQLNKVIDRFLNSSILENNKKHLSSDGQTFIEKFKELVAVLQTALEEKNHDELFQSMIYHIHKSEELLKVDQDELRENQQQAQNEAQLGGQAILKIAKLFLFNAQFRNLLTQILTIAQQTMGGAIQAGGQKISNKISSSSEANNQDRNLAEGSRDKSLNKSDFNSQQDSHDQNDDDERIRNATFAAMGGIGAATATGGGAYLANDRIRDSQDQQHDNSNFPDKHVDFLTHRFADPEPIASTTDDAGNSIPTGELGQNVSRHPGDYDQKELNTGTTRELYGERLNHGTVLGDDYNLDDNRVRKLVRQHNENINSPDSDKGFITDVSEFQPTDEYGNTESAASANPLSVLPTASSNRIDSQVHPQRTVADQAFLTNSSLVRPTKGSTNAHIRAPQDSVDPHERSRSNYISSGPTATTVDPYYRNASPSSFADTGGIVNASTAISQGDSKYEQFYGNHMDVYGSPLNQPQEQRMPSNDAAGSGGFQYGQFYGNRMGAYKPPQADSSQGQSSGIGSDSSAFKNPSEEHAPLIPGSRVDTGAGYDRIQSKHSVPSEEINNYLSNPSNFEGQDADDQVKRHAREFTGSHVMDRLDTTTRPGGGLATKQKQQQQSSVTNTAGLENQHLGTSDGKISHGLDACSSGLMGISGAAAAGAGISALQGHNREQQDVASDDLGSSSQNDNLMGNNSHNSDVSSSMNKMANKLNPQAMDDGKTNEKSSQQQDASVDEIITKLKEILTTVQKNPEYQKAIQTIVSLFNLWGSRLSSGQGMDRRNSSAVELSERGEYYKNTAAYEAKTIIEDWAQGKSMDPIIQKSTDLYNKLKTDDTLYQLYDRVMVYIKRLLQEPGYLASDESTEEGKKLVEKSRQSTLEKYKPEINGLIQESSDIVQAISDDKIANDISEKVKAIHRTLWYDSNGNAAFKPHLLNDIRTTLIPAMIKLIKYVPLPQIVYSDKQYEIAVENMVLEGNSLMPDIFEIKMDDFLSFRPNFTVDYINSQSLNVRLIGIQTSMDDVIFYYKRKTGFPRLSDSGVISFKTGGSGMNISMRIGSDSIDQAHTFRIDQCHCMIDKLDIKVNHCKHDILYKVFNPMLTGIVKRQICKAVEDKITDTFRTSDAKMTRRLWNKRLSGELGETSDNRRPGFFSHLVTVLNQKVANM